MRIGLDVRGLSLRAFEMEEPEEVLEVARAQHEHARSDDGDDDTAHGEVAEHEPPPSRDGVEQADGAGGRPDQPRGRTASMSPAAPATTPIQPMRLRPMRTAASPIARAKADNAAKSE